MGASIEKYSKEASRIKHDELARWSKRFKDSHKACHMLRGEILADDSLTSSLLAYLEKKRTEVEISKVKLKSAHVNKINAVYQLEVANFNNIILEAAELLQENYLVLRSCGALDNKMTEKLNHLEKLMQGQRNVKFTDNEEPAVANSEAAEAQLGQYLNLTDFDHDAMAANAQRKRINEEDENDSMLETDLKKSKNSSARDDFQFARPSAMKSINFGTSSMSTNHNMNQTFEMEGAAFNETVILTERTNHVSTAPMPSTSSSASRGKLDRF